MLVLSGMVSVVKKLGMFSVILLIAILKPLRQTRMCFLVQLFMWIWNSAWQMLSPRKALKPVLIKVVSFL